MHITINTSHEQHCSFSCTCMLKLQSTRSSNKQHQLKHFSTDLTIDNVCNNILSKVIYIIVYIFETGSLSNLSRHVTICYISLTCTYIYACVY